MYDMYIWRTYLRGQYAEITTEKVDNPNSKTNTKLFKELWNNKPDSIPLRDGEYMNTVFSCSLQSQKKLER